MICIKIIAECAINYNSMKEAKLMVKKCKDLGLFLCKFQLFNKENIVNPSQEVRDYCIKRMLTFEQAKELFDYGRSIGQEVFFTVDFPEAVDWCERIGVKYYKIRHYDRFNSLIVEKVKATNKPTFISCDFMEYPKFVGTNIIPLYCIPKYPAKFTDYERIMPGMSDHTPDLELLKVAIQNKCLVFERHVCLTKLNCLEHDWASSFRDLKVLGKTLMEAMK